MKDGKNTRQRKTSETNTEHKKERNTEIEREREREREINGTKDKQDIHKQKETQQGRNITTKNK